MPILELKNLSMRFGGLLAISQLDLAVERGTIFSIIGPNGAGKTTVFNVITGIYEPTEGSVRFEGRQLRRPWSWRVAVACLLVGAVTGVVAAVTSVNVDRLWRAAIKRNTTHPDRPFTYAAAWRDAWGYVRGDLAVEPARGNRWSVVSADGRRQLDTATSEREAQQLLADYREIMRHGSSRNSIQRRGDEWVVPAISGPGESAATGQRVLAVFDSRAAAQERLDLLAQVAAESAAQVRLAWIALFGGLAVGSAGAYAVWRRSRATPEVIALGGIARTFQNIRLFQNMTVLENLLVAMDRSYRAGLLSMLAHTPSWKRDERQTVERARELLGFVGLTPYAHALAKSLPYGNQRRLEIARALAAAPRLLLLDEPAAGMNPAETAELMQLIRRIREQGLTVVLIEHHMSLVMGISDRIAVLDYGRKIAEGTPEQVRSDPRVIEAYLGKDAEAGR